MDRLTTLYKIQRGLVETDTGDIVRTNDRRTRGQQRLYQPAVKVTVYKASFFPKTIREWNLLPTSITDADTIQEFCAGHAAITYYKTNVLTSFELYKDVLTLERVGCLFLSLLVKSTFLEKKPDHFVEKEEDCVV